MEMYFPACLLPNRYAIVLTCCQLFPLFCFFCCLQNENGCLFPPVRPVVLLFAAPVKVVPNAFWCDTCRPMCWKGGADPPVHSPHDWLGSWRFPLGQQAVQVQSLVTWPVAEIEFLKRLRSPGLHLTRLPFSHGLPGPAGSGHHHQLGLNGFHLANSTHAAEIYARQVRELIHFVLMRILHILAYHIYR